MRTTLTVETLINQECGVVFDVLADLRRYDAWLPHSIVFKGTTLISEGPVHVGTTYVESSLWGTRRGTITELDRPERLSYWQPMTLRPAWMGVIDVRVGDSLLDLEVSTKLTRALSLGFQGPVRHFKNAVARSFRTEIERIHVRLKDYAEALPRTAMNG